MNIVRPGDHVVICFANKYDTEGDADLVRQAILDAFSKEHQGVGAFRDLDVTWVAAGPKDSVPEVLFVYRLD